MKLLQVIIGIIMTIAGLLMIIITWNEFAYSKPVTFSTAFVLTSAIIFYLMREFIMPLLYKHKDRKNGLRNLNIPIFTDGTICNNKNRDCQFLERENDFKCACSLFKTTLDKIGGEDKSVVETISTLKERFQKCINATCDENEVDRVLVFVDDLDRLQPLRAVELLEVLKIFLDCERCVFVLALDYNVVVSGVKQKYGSDFKADKGRSFFDTQGEKHDDK